jgi:hypothetical protein
LKILIDLTQQCISFVIATGFALGMTDLGDCAFVWGMVNPGAPFPPCGVPSAGRDLMALCNDS